MDHIPLPLVPDLLVSENIFLSAGGKDILKGATIRAEKGCITGLLGRNGSGKSTMLQSIFGARHAQECDVFLNGIKKKHPYTISGLLNYLPQKSFIPRHLTLAAIAGHFDVNMDQVLHWFPSAAVDRNKSFSELSGGSERLYAVVILLLAETRFSLLDEPFSHIMPLHMEPLKALLLHQKQKKGIIITDHMYGHLLEVSDRIYLMKKGQSIYIRDRNDLVLHGYLRDYAG